MLAVRYSINLHSSLVIHFMNLVLHSVLYPDFVMFEFLLCGVFLYLDYQSSIHFWDLIFRVCFWLQVEELNTMAKEHEKNSEFKASTSKNLLCQCEHKDSKVSYCVLGLCETCFKHVSSFFLV